MIQSSQYWVFTQRIKNTNLKGYMHPNVYNSIIYNSQIMEAAQATIDRWMDKEVDKERILLTHKKEWNLVICNNMDGAREYKPKWY